MMRQKDFYQSLKGLSWFKSILCVRSNRDSDQFSVDPYYEPLLRFMICINSAVMKDYLILPHTRIIKNYEFKKGSRD